MDGAVSGPVLISFTSEVAFRRPALLLQREGDDRVAALGVDLHVAAGGDHDVLLAARRVGRRRRVDAGAGVEFPQDAAALGVIGLEPAVGFAGEKKPAGSGERTADWRRSWPR